MRERRVNNRLRLGDVPTHGAVDCGAAPARRTRRKARPSRIPNSTPHPTSARSPFGDSFWRDPWNRSTTAGNGLRPKK